MRTAKTLFRIVACSCCPYLYFGSAIMLVTCFWWILGSWVTICLGKSCSFGLPRVPFVNCCRFVCLVVSLLVLRAGCWVWLCRFLTIAYLFTLIRLGGCPGWSESSLGAQPFCRFSHVAAHLFSFSVWYVGQDVEFDCIGSWSLPFIYSQFILNLLEFVKMYYTLDPPTPNQPGRLRKSTWSYGISAHGPVPKWQCFMERPGCSTGVQSVGRIIILWPGTKSAVKEINLILYANNVKHYFTHFFYS